MPVGRCCYAQMYSCGNRDCSYSSDFVYNLQRCQEKCRYENMRTLVVYSGCQRISEERDAETGKDGASDMTMETIRL